MPRIPRHSSSELQRVQALPLHFETTTAYPTKETRICQDNKLTIIKYRGAQVIK